MTPPPAEPIHPAHPAWPHQLTDRLGTSAPTALNAIGPVSILSGPRTGLFCSVRTPGEAIIRTLDAVRHLRDKGLTVISGFHSPLEKECLKILLRGKQPLIICPARAIEGMRIPAGCRAAFDAGRILFLSPFTKQPRRVTKESALRRNQVVASLSDDAYVAHRDSGGKTDQIMRKLEEWGVEIL